MGCAAMDLGDPGRSEEVISAFQQLPVLLTALDGPSMVVTAWSERCRQVFGEPYQSLGTPLTEAESLRGSGLTELMLGVYETGQPDTRSELRIPVRDAEGMVQECFLDIVYEPWRRSDGSIRGVLSLAFDVSDRVRARHPHRDSTTWEERFHTSHEALRALQASLLPPSVPVLPGVQISAGYLLAEADTAAGGDWFSAIPLPDGRVALVAGDVVGHGVTAAATMGQLRSVLRERLLSGAGISGALTALDRIASYNPDADAATVCAGSW
jgi:hypothetical protein